MWVQAGTYTCVHTHLHTCMHWFILFLSWLTIWSVIFASIDHLLLEVQHFQPLLLWPFLSKISTYLSGNYFSVSFTLRPLLHLTLNVCVLFPVVPSPPCSCIGHCWVTSSKPQVQWKSVERLQVWASLAYHGSRAQLPTEFPSLDKGAHTWIYTWWIDFSKVLTVDVWMFITVSSTFLCFK